MKLTIALITGGATVLGIVLRFFLARWREDRLRRQIAEKQVSDQTEAIKEQYEHNAAHVQTISEISAGVDDARASELLSSGIKANQNTIRLSTTRRPRNGSRRR